MHEVRVRALVGPAAQADDASHPTLAVSLAELAGE